MHLLHLANCKFLYGPDTEILTTLSPDGFRARVVTVDVNTATWKIVIQHEVICTSLESVIAAVHETSASIVLERLGSGSIHHCKQSWAEMDIRPSSGARTAGFRSQVSNDLNFNGRKVSSKTFTDHEAGSEAADCISSLEKPFEIVIPDSSVNEDTVDEIEYDNEVFMMPEPAVEETPKEETLSGEPCHEPFGKEALPAKKKSTKLKGKKTTSSHWGYNAPVAEDCVDMPTSSGALCEDLVQEALFAEPHFESAVGEVLPATTKMDKASRKEGNVLPSFYSDVPDIEKSLEEVATPVADWENPALESVLDETPPETHAEENLSISQQSEQANKTSSYSAWCSWEEPTAGPAAEEMSSTASTVESLVDLGSAAAEFAASDSGKSHEQEQKLYDVYLTVKCEYDTYRILTTLSENTKAGIVKKAKACYRTRRTFYERHPVREFCIESAASKDGPIDTTMLGNGDWTDRLKFFAAHTESGIPELTVGMHNKMH